MVIRRLLTNLRWKVIRRMEKVSTLRSNDGNLSVKGCFLTGWLVDLWDIRLKHFLANVRGLEGRDTLKRG